MISWHPHSLTAQLRWFNILIYIFQASEPEELLFKLLENKIEGRAYTIVYSTCMQNLKQKAGSLINIMSVYITIQNKNYSHIFLLGKPNYYSYATGRKGTFICSNIGSPAEYRLWHLIKHLGGGRSVKSNCTESETNISFIGGWTMLRHLINECMLLINQEKSWLAL